MNSGYTQTNKKADMAAKMVTKYKMNGPDKVQGGSGMKFKGNGKNTGRGGGEISKHHGTGGKGALKQKPKGSNPDAHFISSGLYKQSA